MKIRIENIIGTKNPLVKQLELRCEIDKPAEANQVGFFLEGLDGVVPNVEKRVAYLTVSQAFIDKHGLAAGDADFCAKIGKEGRLVVKIGRAHV